MLLTLKNPFPLCPTPNGEWGFASLSLGMQSMMVGQQHHNTKNKEKPWCAE